MNKINLIFYLAFLIIATSLSAQNIKQYQFLLKGNMTDFLFMGRLVPEVEFPIFKNTSVTGNLGFHYRDFFYDNMDKTTTNPSLFIFSLGQAFPAKNALGWNAGLGLRQYFNIHDHRIKNSFLEFKGFYRKTTFREDFKVYYLDSSDYEANWVSGLQQIKSWYIGLGRTNLFKNKGITVDISAGIRKNFIDLNTCLAACTIPDWMQPFQNGTKTTDPWTASIIGDYTARPNFYQFRMALKIVFLKVKRK